MVTVVTCKPRLFDFWTRDSLHSSALDRKCSKLQGVQGAGEHGFARMLVSPFHALPGPRPRTENGRSQAIGMAQDEPAAGIPSRARQAGDMFNGLSNSTKRHIISGNANDKKK